MSQKRSKIFLIIESIVLSFLFLAAQAFLIGCDEFLTDPHQKSIHGSGIIESRTAEISGFNSISIETFGSVQVTQGDYFSVSYRADDNIIDLVDIYKSGNTLVVDISNHDNYDNCTYEVEVTLPLLEELSTNSAGSFRGTNKFSNSLIRLNANSAGGIVMNLEVEELITNIGSAGSVDLKGSAVIHRADLKSAGSMHAYDLVTEETYIDVSSAGNAHIFVENYLDADISSVGSVYYKGNPTIQYNVTSLGHLINAN